MTAKQTATIEMHIVTSLGLHAGIDAVAITNAFQLHIDNSLVKRIHVLTETPLAELFSKFSILENSKFYCFQFENRPSFADLFHHCSYLDGDGNIIAAIMNADVSFSSEVDIVKCNIALSAAKFRGNLAILSITRRDKIGESFLLNLYDESGLPNYISSDCWVFSPPLLLADIGFIRMGDMNCDLILNYELTKSQHVVLNPCLDIKILHHEGINKGIDYYKNKNVASKDDDNWHYISRCNVPYVSYGIAWNNSAWINVGYMPLPKNNAVKTIYVFIESTLERPEEQELIIALDVISKTSHCDLMIVSESIGDLDLNFIKKIGTISNQIYLTPVESIKSTLVNLISGKSPYHNSISLIRNISLLTPLLISEFDAIIFDCQNPIAGNRIHQLPVGYPYLETYVKARFGVTSANSIIRFPDVFALKANCTLITSLYKSEDFIDGFTKNIQQLINYEYLFHIILFSKLSAIESAAIQRWHYSNENLILVWYKEDPGLYECWNAGIRIAPTDYLSNANVDDLRHPYQVQALLETLRSRKDVAVVASAIVGFEKYGSVLSDIDCSHPWYADQGGDFGMTDLAKLTRDESGKLALSPHNLPHCMPVWRRSIHENYGYFDEKRFGTFADWAFWLKVTKGGEKGYLDNRPLSYYYINLESHNRRGEKLLEYHRAIENEFIADFYFSEKEPFPRKLNLTGLNQSFGQHRNSFNMLIESLHPLHLGADGIEFIPFIERYFVWGNDDGEAASSNPRPLKKSWVGVLHVPFDAPKWFEYGVSPETIFSTTLWKESVPYCKGIICLTEDLRQDLGCWYPHLPSLFVKFPTTFDVVTFNFNAYLSSPKLVQAGDWLRQLQFIYKINAPGHKKIFLKKSCTDAFLQREIDTFGDIRNDTVTTLDFVSNDEYDELLSSSVVVAWLYGASANNIIIECIARRTPILINPLPSVVEYLGVDYPLYMDDVISANAIVNDIAKVKAAHVYLENRSYLRDSLTYKAWLNSIANSSFYKNLN